MTLSPVRRTWLVVALLLVASFLRFYRIGAQSFWNDEGNSARIAERTVPLILAGAAGDIHPPGYYLLLAAWRGAVGESEFALRAFSALAGIALAALVYALAKRFFGRDSALAALGFAAIHPALIYYSQEARMYSLAAAMSAALWLAVSNWQLAISGGKRPAAWRRGAAVALITAAGLYTHYSFAFAVIAVNLFVFARVAWRAWQKHSPLVRGRLWHWLAWQGVALLLFAPWLSNAIRQLITWPSAREYLPPASAVLGVARWLMFGSTISAPDSIAGLTGLACLLAVAAWRRGRWLAPVLWLLVPALFTVAFGLFSDTFAKFLIISVPAVCIALGRGASALALPEGRGAKHIVAGITAALGLWLAWQGQALSLRNLYFNPQYARADYRGIARYIQSVARLGDAILLNAPNQWEAFTYYYRDIDRVYPVARTRPLDVPAQMAELEDIASTYERLFVIYWGDAQSDPGRVVESWLNENTFKAYDQWYRDVRLAVYAAPRTAAVMQTAADAVFGNVIALDGYSLGGTHFSGGDIVQLTLFWRLAGETPIEERYKVFVHVVSDVGQPPVAQHDGEPGGGLALTNTWGAGQVVADNHGVFLPLDLPAGEFVLNIGLYDVANGARLILPDGADALTLATIHVR